MRYFKFLKLFATVAALALGAGTMQAESAFTADEVAASCAMSELEAPPKPVRQSPPSIPPELQGIKASILVGFLIDEKGEVTKPRIVQSSNDSFNDIALRCVRNWEFSPGKKAGKPVIVRVVVPLRFK